jgi:hypothetical protein
MAALMGVLMMFCIVNVLVLMHFSIVLMCMFMLAVCMATHLGSPPFSPMINIRLNFHYKKIVRVILKAYSHFPHDLKPLFVAKKTIQYIIFSFNLFFTNN